MKKRTKVSRDLLITLWDEKERRVPLSVMLTTVELESGIGTNLYDATASRYEKKLHERYPNRPASDCTSWGLFQILGMNLNSSNATSGCLVAAEIPLLNERIKAEPSEESIEIYIRLQLAAYDEFMASLFRRHKLPQAFKRYNGSGPRAQVYMERAIAIQERIEKELGKSPEK